MKQRDLKQIEDFRDLRPFDLPSPDPTIGETSILILKFVALYLGLAFVLALLIVFAPAIVQAIRAVFS